jgi:transcriptional regulator with XRE-family HTH domain
MARDSQTGSRIRERRVMLGVKQTDLARGIGISASYLNLIEHNRRRIGGKLLLDIAAALRVEAQALTEGAEAALLGILGEAAQAARMPAAEAARAEAFAGRFPGWAGALAASQRRVVALERTVETLSDRMAHDPHLAASMHELLTTAAAVRSTAEILAAEGMLEREWQDRFHANLDADSRRLARSAQALAGYLEQTKGPASGSGAPQEQVEAFLAAHDFHFPQLEDGAQQIQIPDLIVQSGHQVSEAAQFILRGVLEQVRLDARVLPIAVLAAAVRDAAPDPVALAQHFGVPVVLILRRLAGVTALGAGLVVCDRSGTVIFRKSIDGFSVPGFDSCCPLWPLFGALGAPGVVLHDRIGQLGRGQVQFDAYATTEHAPVSGYNTPALARGVMLLLRAPADDARVALRAVGATCRICPQTACAARREPSILGV